MKKKVLTTLSIVLIMGMAALGILAYLSDTDSDVNVMTLGNVSIVQNEYERNADGELEEFSSKWDSNEKKALYPAVYNGSSIPWANSIDWVEPDAEEWKVVEDNDNVIDKFVTVTNDGESDAFVRTLFAIEVGDEEAASDFIHIVINNNNDVVWEWVQDDEGNYVIIDVDGATYQVAAATYSNAIVPGDETIPSLKQVYLDKDADNDVVKSLGDDYRILAISQAVQKQGFADAKTALDTGFGDVAENAYIWFNSLDTSNCIKVGNEKFDTLQDAVNKAAETGEDVIIIGSRAIVDENGAGSSIVIPEGKEIKIIGKNSATLTRAEGFTGTMFSVYKNATLTLEDITVDGGAVWSGEINPTLQRGTTNAGVVATGALVETGANACIELNEGAILQNNDGANTVNLGTRTGGSLIINGGEIINNHSAAGAIWGGGTITINSGKVNGNHGGIGGAIRVVTNVGTVLTMNGGEMNHNYSDGNGGAIWAGSSKSNNVYVLNGGEMAYNYSAATGGAIYAGYYETVKIGGTFNMHDNDCADNIGAAIRFHDHASFVMTGGEIYNNGDSGNSLFLYNNSASITGGKIVDDFGYSGGLGLTWGNAEVDGVIAYNLSTNHNTAYLAKEFGTLKFTVKEGTNFAAFNFKPASGYTYTAGDEAKLVCLNTGYETYWDSATSTFRLKAE